LAALHDRGVAADQNNVSGRYKHIHSKWLSNLRYHTIRTIQIERWKSVDPRSHKIETAPMAEQAAYDLLRRIPPANIEARLYDTIRLCPSLADALLSTVDTPLKIVTDGTIAYVACEFNRDLDSYRVPGSNTYVPKLKDGQKIAKRHLALETKGNLAFAAYRQLYFQGGISSVYCWEIEKKVFGFGVFIKHEVKTKLRTGEVIEGCIDCSDVVEVNESKSTATYTLTSSVLLSIALDVQLSTPLVVNGTTSDRKESVKPFSNDDDHIVNIGELIESNAALFREKINTIYVSTMRHIVELIVNQESNAVQRTLADALNARFGLGH
jgi:capping protein beta